MTFRSRSICSCCQSYSCCCKPTLPPMPVRDGICDRHGRLPGSPRCTTFGTTLAAAVKFISWGGIAGKNGPWCSLYGGAPLSVGPSIAENYMARAFRHELVWTTAVVADRPPSPGWLACRTTGAARRSDASNYSGEWPHWCGT
jgi:hypothetical protein